MNEVPHVSVSVSVGMDVRMNVFVYRISIVKQRDIFTRRATEEISFCTASNVCSVRGPSSVIV